MRNVRRFGADDPTTSVASAYVFEHHVVPLLRDDATRQRLIDEHRSLPLPQPGIEGRPAREHGAELARLLDWLRTGVVAGKYVLLRCPDCSGLQIAQMPDAPGNPPALVEEHCYRDPGEAEHAVFLRRIDALLALIGQDEARGAVPRAPTCGAPVGPDLELTAYASELSIAPGESVDLHVSSARERPFTASLVRLGGPRTPGSPMREDEVPVPGLDRVFPGRRQRILTGSYVVIPATAALRAALDPDRDLSLVVHVWPTNLRPDAQGLITWWSEELQTGLALTIDPEGRCAAWVGDDRGTVVRAVTARPLATRAWHLVGMSFSPARGTLSVFQHPVDAPTVPGDPSTSSFVEVHGAHGWRPPDDVPMLLAAVGGGGTSGQTLERRRCPDLHADLPLPCVTGLYDGKLEAPAVLARTVDPDEVARLAAEGSPLADCVAGWDFAANLDIDGVPGTRVAARLPDGPEGVAVNLPARGVTGSRWSGTTTSFAQAPEEYAAMHFHHDDLDDARWDPDVNVTLPPDLQSGVYALRLRVHGGYGAAQERHVPLFVRPSRDRGTAPIALVMPTATYLAYGNDRPLEEPATEVQSGRVPVAEIEDLFLLQHPEYGTSLYGVHADGSGISYASRRRPLLTLTPRHRTSLASGPAHLWGFPADLHIVDWLAARGQDVDVLTDEDVHREGTALLSRYRVVLTGTHPEYVSKEMLDAYAAHADGGGRLMYLGGNGFYWVTCFHPHDPAVIEVRRGAEGTRPWTSAPGEARNAFDGRPGGTWHRRGRRPSQLVGVSFSAPAMDVSAPYRRLPDSFAEDSAWIFDGVDHELFGAFGEIGGGAAGLEMDRAEPGQGTPSHARILASSQGHTSLAMEAVEFLAFHMRGYNEGADANPGVRADIVWFTTPAGGAVFSVGSMAWAGSLAENGYDNDIARITGNVLNRFLGDEPLPPTTAS